MKVIGKVPVMMSEDNEVIGEKTIVQLTSEESQALQELLNSYGEDIDRYYWQREANVLPMTNEEIDLKEILAAIHLFCDVKRSANRFGKIYDEFEKLVGGIGDEL